MIFQIHLIQLLMYILCKYEKLSGCCGKHSKVMTNWWLKIAGEMMEKFHKHWSDYCVILSIAMILDSRMKLQALWFYYLKLNHATCEEKVGVVKSKMYKFWWVCESKFHYIGCINKFLACSSSWTRFQFRGNWRDGRIGSMCCKLIDLLISYILW